MAALGFVLALCLLPSVLPAPLTDAKHTVQPSRTDQHGRHLTYNLFTTRLPTDHTSDNTRPQYYFKLDALGKTFSLNVSDSEEFVSNDHQVEYHHREDGVRRGEERGCHHLTGSVREDTTDGQLLESEGGEGWVAISNCGGLRGVIATASGYLYIEPLGAVPDNPHTHPHLHLLSTQQLNHTSHCTYDETALPPPPSSPEEGRVRRSPISNAASSEHYVEVAMVADWTMLEYHGAHELEAYLFTLMNMVAHIYRDPSIGHAMNIVLVRTIILETEQAGLSISSDALHSLGSFCSWQSSSTLTRDIQHDVTVLVTRTNICEGFGSMCGTLGIAEFRGACTTGKSCSISEDIGLATAFTIAHELGHSLGIRHDGDMSVVCPPSDHYIMAPSFAQSHNPHIWSQCSRQQLAEFLQSPENTCLFNQPAMMDDNSSSLPPSSVPLPGLETTPTEQCQLMLGEHASHCSPNTTDGFCHRLWCHDNGQSDCEDRHVPPAPGTECVIPGSGKGGVCYQGECVEFGSLIEPVDGGWGEWGPWDDCSLTCGTGVQGSSRSCDSPIPANGGRYCLGPSHRHQTCNTFACPAPSDIRQELCETEPPHSRYTEWQAPSLEYISRRNLNQCGHHCLSKPSDVLFTVTMGLPDGTPCLYTPSPPPSHSLQLSSVPESLGVCVSGDCVPVGCDHTLHSMASRDDCGVWCGNGSSCVSVSDIYTIPKDNTTTSDYVYHKTVTLPRGSGQVKVSELRPTHNLYLAATTTTENFNGNYRVKEGDLSSYWFAGAKWWYERPEGGIEVLRTAGVLKDDVTIFIIANTNNLSIHYSAGIPTINVSIFTVAGVWRVGEWGGCDGACGEGVRRREVECVQSDMVVQDSHCETKNRPSSEEPCSTDVGCYYEWRVSPWSNCNATCGSGEQSRHVQCILSNNNTVVNARYCDNDVIPSATVQCYSEQGCVYQWQVEDWSPCSSECGEGERERAILCLLTNNHTAASTDSCRAVGPRPETSQRCYTENGCVFTWQITEWSDCSASCGEGQRGRQVSCIVASNGSVVSTSHCESPDMTAPSNTAQCYTEEGCIYQWHVGTWSDCSASCGAGFRRRPVTCLLTNNATSVHDTLCSTISRPATHSQCYTEEGCTYQWHVGTWSDCSADCGAGFRRREVACVLINNSTTVQDSLCNSVHRPATHSQCYSEERCMYTWITAEWTECSAECGYGERQRNVWCVLTNNDTAVDGGHCQGTKPDSRLQCYSEEHCRYTWWYGNWTSCSTECGQGTRSRELACYLTNNNTRVDNHRCPDDSIPADVSGCYDETGCVFTWSSAPWTECDTTCGAGYKTRGTHCIVTSNGTTVDNIHCSAASRPAVRTSCYNETGCVFVWTTEPWTECDNTCGGGNRTRDTSCVLTNNGTTVEDVYCTVAARPAVRTSCYEESGCVFVWASEPWTECDTTCGAGYKTRETSCILTNNGTTVEDVYCSTVSRPAVRTSCYEESGCVFVWTSEPWTECDSLCGAGYKTTETSCILTNNGTTVEDVYCSTASRPAVRTYCYEESGCVFVWTSEPWTECDSSCGAGYKTTETSCILTNNGTTVEDVYCSTVSRPAVRTSCYEESGCVFVWASEPWTECDSSCGAGYKTRETSCILTNNGTTVEDVYCSTISKPAVRKSCYEESGCVFVWASEPWTECDSLCGAGYKTRETSCILTNNGTTVEDVYCSTVSRPAVRTSCYEESGCVFVWASEPWTECDSSCGAGYKTRETSCILTNNGTTVEDVYCSTVSRPAVRTSCYEESGCVFVWASEPWTECDSLCGAGYKTRETSCILTNNGTTVEDVYCSTVSRPAVRTSCYEESGCEFVWASEPWTECDSSCGAGYKTRETSCILTNNGTTVEDVYCSTVSRPAVRTSCYEESGCVFVWASEPWTECDSSCGAGYKTRETSCILTNNGTTVEDVYCSTVSRPAVRTSCYEESGCVFVWVSEPWTECDNTCGAGYKTRETSCVLTNNGTTVDDRYCSPGSRPAIRTSCYDERGCVFEWQTTPWTECSAVCGGGETRRTVTCVLTNNDTTVDSGHCSRDVPVGVASCGEDCQYVWSVGEWGECAGDSCEEEGRRWREVGCVLVNNQSVVSDGWCQEGEKPAMSTSCQAEVCLYQWVVGEWGRCDAPCGEGERGREVTCELVNGRGGRGRGVDKELCAGSLRPHVMESCDTEPCINFSWWTGAWNKCDAECEGYGSQTRAVLCRHENGTVVPDGPYCTAGEDRPPTTRRCQGGSCIVDPCLDSPHTSCNIVVRIRLCHVQYLRNLCCHSCRRF